MPPKSGYPDRISRFEQFESRHLLSVNPLAPEALDTSSVQTTSSAITPLSAPDLLQVDYTTASDPIGNDYVRDHYDLSGFGQTVVIIDTGLAYDHPAFMNSDGTSRVVGGYDFAENDNDPYDEGYHGTHVTGILAANDPNVAGLAPDVDIVVLRVFDDKGHSEFKWVEDAMQWVVDHQYDFANPITTVNVSLGALLSEQTADGCASLEDELADLEASGIFTAVAAGNRFTSMQTVGLTFPASSEYVVPVASVDGNGGMSFFSQRDSQVIAAPGRSIVSTVPDKYGDHDGKDDDYAMFSGTSMATPYVSGASILLREALTDVGVKNINQDMIYDLMYSTGDFIYDKVTGQSYCSLNLARAVETAYTSYIATPVDPEPVDPEPVDPEPVDPEPVDPEPVDPEPVDPEPVDPGPVDPEPVDPEPTPSVVATDWGTVSDATFADVAITSGSAQFNFTAARDGLMSVMLSTTATDVRLLDAEGNQVTSFTAAGRADFAVIGGQRYTLEVSTGIGTSSTNDTLNARLVNLVSVTGSTVSIFGTEADDRFAVTVGTSSFDVSINDVDYKFSTATTNQVHFDGGAGNDQAVLTGNSGKDSAEVHVGYASMVGAGYELSTAGTEVHHLLGGGGVDAVVMYDSAGKDLFDAAVGDVTLAGEGFSQRATGFTNAMARSTAGGYDSVLFHDSTGNDTFVVTMDYAKMTGAGFNLRTEGFFEVKATSSAGGQDTAYLSDSAGNDTLKTTTNLATMTGTGFHFQAEGFRYLLAYSQEGGNDKALAYDSPGNDQVLATPEFVKISGTDFYQRFSGFASVDVRATAGGNDIALLKDSTGDDTFEASTTGARLAGDGFQNTMYGFDSVTASASAGGNDTAILRGSSSDDSLFYDGVEMQLFGNSFKYRASQFDYFYAEAGGGHDKAVLIANGEAGSPTGSRLTSTIESLRLANETTAADLYGFEHIQAYAAKSATHESEAEATDYLLELFGIWGK